MPQIIQGLFDQYITEIKKIYGFNLDNDLDIMPITKSEEHFKKWLVNYPFYATIHKDGVVLYDAA